MANEDHDVCRQGNEQLKKINPSICTREHTHTAASKSPSKVTISLRTTLHHIINTETTANYVLQQQEYSLLIRGKRV